MKASIWRTRHWGEGGEALHHVAISVATDVLDAIEELADRERISRAHAGGELIELGVATA
jgi:hypothetical protein